MSRKLTLEKERLWKELVTLKEGVLMKIRRICLTNFKLPYEQLVAGRRIKEFCLKAISSIDEGGRNYISDLLERIKGKGYAYLKF